MSRFKLLNGNSAQLIDHKSKILSSTNFDANLYTSYIERRDIKFNNFVVKSLEIAGLLEGKSYQDNNQIYFIIHTPSEGLRDSPSPREVISLCLVVYPLETHSFHHPTHSHLHLYH